MWCRMEIRAPTPDEKSVTHLKKKPPETLKSKTLPFVKVVSILECQETLCQIAAQKWHGSHLANC